MSRRATLEFIQLATSEKIKEAYQFAEKSCSDNPESPVPKLMKSYALYRMDMADKARELAISARNTLMDGKPQASSDIDAEIYAQWVLSYIDILPDYVPIISKKFEVNPTEQNALCLFMHNVNALRPQEQQKLALVMAKAYKRTVYTYWVICSYYQQFLITQDQRQKNLYLQLADGFYTKLIQENLVKTSSHFALWMNIQHALKRYTKILTTLSDSSLGTLFNQSRDRLERIINTVSSIRSSSEDQSNPLSLYLTGIIHKIAKVLLAECDADDWTQWTNFIDTTCILTKHAWTTDKDASFITSMSSSEQEDDKQVVQSIQTLGPLQLSQKECDKRIGHTDSLKDFTTVSLSSSFDEAESFITQQIIESEWLTDESKRAERKLIRGPRLALIELAKRRLQSEGGSDSTDKLVHVKSFLRTNLTKPSFLLDIETTFTELDQAEKAQLISEMKTSLNSSIESFKSKTEGQLQENEIGRLANCCNNVVTLESIAAESSPESLSTFTPCSCLPDLIHVVKSVISRIEPETEIRPTGVPEGAKLKMALKTPPPHVTSLSQLHCAQVRQRWTQHLANPLTPFLYDSIAELQTFLDGGDCGHFQPHIQLASLYSKCALPNSLSNTWRHLSIKHIQSESLFFFFFPTFFFLNDKSNTHTTISTIVQFHNEFMKDRGTFLLYTYNPPKQGEQYGHSNLLQSVNFIDDSGTGHYELLDSAHAMIDKAANSLEQFTERAVRQFYRIQDWTKLQRKGNQELTGSDYDALFLNLVEEVGKGVTPQYSSVDLLTSGTPATALRSEAILNQINTVLQPTMDPSPFSTPLSLRSSSFRTSSQFEQAAKDEAKYITLLIFVSSQLLLHSFSILNSIHPTPSTHSEHLTSFNAYLSQLSALSNGIKEKSSFALIPVDKNVLASLTTLIHSLFSVIPHLSLSASEETLSQHLSLFSKHFSTFIEESLKSASHVTPVLLYSLASLVSFVVTPVSSILLAIHSLVAPKGGKKGKKSERTTQTNTLRTSIRQFQTDFTTNLTSITGFIDELLGLQRLLHPSLISLLPQTGSVTDVAMETYQGQLKMTLGHIHEVIKILALLKWK
ncbi:putative N-terminal acetyltransferase B complex non-catalytic subunit [Blattamonas nauphoetae]|uniref:N-terminal acetyltransferase B complex non-catalytic subunit n=1 Tax=Blattamonas nauphoetae TaxID=2049346 RepID=A0ABQ9YHS0_9EUKA|nr:putative N-terminal acetyltransferase B complex non-catalytic subunit [Blattamonas nauphoetae]